MVYILYSRDARLVNTPLLVQKFTNDIRLILLIILVGTEQDRKNSIYGS